MTANTGHRSGLARRVFILAGLAGMSLFLALGVWQVQRLFWKLDLIERVEERLSAKPVPAPGPAVWPVLDPSHDEYTRVELRGQYLAGPQPLVQAVTEAGRGFWVMTPMQMPDGWIVLVNRGFIPESMRNSPPLPDTTNLVTIQGLMRTSQPDGAFLRKNDPVAGRWFSRDVGAMAATLRLERVAPYFVDAAAGDQQYPAGGLTVVHFRNSHLAYALTWFALAAGLGFLLYRTFSTRLVSHADIS